MSKNKTYKPVKHPSVSRVAEAAAVYNTPTKKIQLTRQGIDPVFLLDLMDVYQFTKQEVSRLTDISTKTLSRHIDSGKRFTGLQSDRILELSELYNEGLEVFGNPEKFIKWLNARIPALNNTSPKEWLDTHEGIQLILDELGRIRHGIFA